jgi:hypothetical protein
VSESCRHEPAVLRAANDDRWTDALRAHLGECDDCVAAASVAPWLGRFARIADREHILPDPHVVWLKAKLLQGTAEARYASRPLEAAQLLAYFVVAGGWAALLMWRWDAVETWLRGFTPTDVVVTASRAESVSMLLFALVFVLASMTVMLALHTILAED